MKKNMLTLVVCLIFTGVFAFCLSAKEYQEVTDREGDVNYISEPEKVGDTIEIKGYRGQNDNVIDDIRDDLKEREEELDADEGLDI